MQKFAVPLCNGKSSHGRDIARNMVSSRFSLASAPFVIWRRSRTLVTLARAAASPALLAAVPLLLAGVFPSRACTTFHSTACTLTARVQR